MAGMSETDALSITYQGQTRELRFPKDEGTRAEIERIFKGEEYPILQIPSYQPRVIVDVGAHVGATSLFLHMVFPSASIYSFEPSPANFAFLQRNVAFTDRIQTFPYGLHDRDMRAKLFTGPHSMQSSFVFGANLPSAGPYEDAEARRASDVFDLLGLAKISILKLDAEGCELAILRDLQGALPNIDQIYVEYHSEQDRLAIDQILKDHFVLALGKVAWPHTGSFLYLSKSFLP